MESKQELNECFFIDDCFYQDLEQLAEEMKDEIKSLPDEWTINACCCKLEPIFRFSSEWILDRIDEERFSEDNDDVEKSLIRKVLDLHIPYAMINDNMPKLNYANGNTMVITKQDLIQSLNECE